MLRLQRVKVSILQYETDRRGAGKGGGGGRGLMHALSFTSTEWLTAASCSEEADLSACLETLLRLQKLVLQSAHFAPRL